MGVENKLLNEFPNMLPDKYNIEKKVPTNKASNDNIKVTIFLLFLILILEPNRLVS